MLDPGCSHILRKLHNRRNYGASHTPEERAKGWALHGMYGNPDKIRAFGIAYKELIRSGIIIKGLKNGSMHVWLNPGKAQEIKDLIR